MSKKFLAIQADSIETININTDTTFLLALEAQKRLQRDLSDYTYNSISINIFINELFN